MNLRVRSICFGIFLAALAPGVSLVVLALAMGGANNGPVLDTLSGALVLLLVSFVAASFPSFLLGLPYVLWLHSRNAITWINVCLGAASIGAATLAAFSWAIEWGHPAPELRQYLYGAGLGLLGGISFCLGARPNNSFKPKPLRGSA